MTSRFQLLGADGWSVISSIGALLGGLGTALGLLFFVWQLRHARKSLRQLELNQVAELKPYLSVTVINGVVRNQPAILLVLKNHGRTPALRVKLDFEPGRVWHFVKPSNFPFSQEKGLSMLAPGEAKTYFLGRPGLNEEFDRLSAEDIQVVMSWESQVSQLRQHQANSINLCDGRFEIVRTDTLFV